MHILAALFFGVTIFVANQGGHSLSAVDPAAGTVRTLALTIAPHNVQTCGQKQVLAVGFRGTASSGMAMGEPGSLISIDPATLKVVESVDVGTSPAHVVCDSKGKFAYVTLSGSAAVEIVDVAGMRLVAKIPVGAYPHGLRMSADDRMLFVANVRDDAISVIDVSKRSIIRQVSLGGSPSQVAVAPDGRTVYATLSDTNEVVAANVETGRVIKRLKVGSNPAQLAITQDGRAIVVANEGTLDNPGTDVVIVNTSTLLPIASVNVATGPHGVAIEGGRAYVTSVFSGTQKVIDIANHRAIRAFSVGAEPAGVTVFP